MFDTRKWRLRGCRRSANTGDWRCAQGSCGPAIFHHQCLSRASRRPRCWPSRPRFLPPRSGAAIFKRPPAECSGMQSLCDWFRYGQLLSAGKAIPPRQENAVWRCWCPGDLEMRPAPNVHFPKPVAAAAPSFGRSELIRGPTSLNGARRVTRSAARLCGAHDRLISLRSAQEPIVTRLRQGACRIRHLTTSA